METLTLTLILVARVLSSMKMTYFGVLVLNGFYVHVHGRWLHEDFAEECVADDQGNDRTCP